MPTTLRHPILFIRPPDPGLRYAHYEGERDLTDLREIEPARRSDVDALAIPPDLAPPCTIEFSGFIEVPADGVYRFFVDSPGPSQLLIADDVIVDLDGQSGRDGLQAGYHPLTVRCSSAAGAIRVAVSLEGPGLTKQPVAPAMLFR